MFRVVHLHSYCSSLLVSNPIQCQQAELVPVLEVDSMIKCRLLFLFVFINRREIEFGDLMCNQIIEMLCQYDDDQKPIVLLNLNYQILLLRREIPVLPGGEELIGQPL